jgi:SAM-dependent methyltransferase
MFDTYAEIFAQRAQDYHHAMKSSPHARDAEFRAVLEPIEGRRAGLVCDMPSGGGYLADYLPDELDYIAIDPATDFFVEWPRPLQRLLAEITNVPLADESVDYVVSLAGLHHEPSLPKVFTEMRRLLRPGGRVVLADVAVDTRPATFLNGFVNEHCPLGHEGKFLDERTAPWLEEAGFNVVDDQILIVPWAFADREEAGEFCRHLFGMTGLDASSVADAMHREIGFELEDGQPRLQWMLRRIVADAA